MVALSRGISSGKSTLATELEIKYSFLRVSTSDLIKVMVPGVSDQRVDLQREGKRLDEKFGGEWIGDSLGRFMSRNPSRSIVLDSVRTLDQLEPVYNAIGTRRVLHVHLTTPDKEREERFLTRARVTDKTTTFEKAISDSTEAKVYLLADKADLKICTHACEQQDVALRVAARLGLYSRTAEQLVDVIIGGQYGSEGKGNIADYLAPEYDVLMRVGGPNAGHKVYEEPHPFTHISLPCGTRRNDKAELLIGPGAILNEEIILKEIADCNVPTHRLSIDPNAVVITAADIEWEKENLKGISSTFNGVGAAGARRLTDRFVGEGQCTLARDIPSLKNYIGETRSRLEKAYAKGSKIQLEGTQGTGLSVLHGEYPYVTSRDTTVSGCLSEAGISPRRVRKITMVVRTYPIRVGGPSGPMKREISWAKIAERSGIDAEELQKHELGSRSGKERRVAEFDWSMLRKASHYNSPTDIALTFVDYLGIENRDARRFDQLSQDSINFIEEIEKVSGTNCSLICTDFTSRCIIDRRAWP